MLVSIVQTYLLPMACAICDVDQALARGSRSRVVMVLSGCYGAFGLLWRSRVAMRGENFMPCCFVRYV